METIIINGVACTLSTKTADQYRLEVAEEKAERRADWMLWHWYARRWAMYGDQEAGSMFSDMYKDEHGSRPHMTRDEVLWFLYGRECWLEHSPECREYRRMKAIGWGLY